MKWYNLSWYKVVSMLDSDIYKGIKEAEVEDRKQNYGDNKLDINIEDEIKSIVKVLFTPWVIFYIVGIIFLLVNRKFIEAAIVIILYIGLLVMKLYPRIKEIKQYKSFSNLNEIPVRVIRDGHTKVLKAEELVVGDIVRIEENSTVAADIRIVESENIKTYEKNITGEKFIVEKYSARVEENVTSFTEIRNMLFRGTNVVSGSGYGIVVATGVSTEIGNVIKLMSNTKNKNNGFIQLINRKINIYSLIIAGIVLGLFGGQFFAKNSVDIQLGSYLVSAALSVTCFLNIVIGLIYINKFFKKGNIELNRLTSMEKITQINMVFIPKDGGVYKNDLEVKSVYVNNKIIRAAEVTKSDLTMQRMMEIAVLCNNAIYNPEKDEARGDNQEIALLKLCYNFEVYRGDLYKTQKRIFEIPFDSDRRIMTSLNRYNRNYRANLRGVVDEILEKCTHIMKDGVEREITQDDITKIKAADFEMSNNGLTTLAIAYRSFGYEPTEDENLESNLVFVSIIGMHAKMIAGVKERINDMKNMGITPILFTDDNKITATTIGKRLGIVRDMFGVMSGVELKNLSSEELMKIIPKIKIFCRVDTELKSRIIKLFIDDGYKVATLGENINDLPILSLSDLAIAKGPSCANMVIKASDMHFEKDYLTGFFKAFAYGKIFIRNIGLYIEYIMALMVLQLVTISAMYNLGYLRSISGWEIAVLNAIILPFFTQSLLINNQDEVENINYYNYIAGYVIQVISVILILDLKPEINHGYILGMGIILAILSSSMINNKIKISGNKFISINYSIIALIVVGFIGIYLFNHSIGRIEAIITIIMAIFFFCIEYILKKWRE